MSELTSRDVEYHTGATRMIGRLVLADADPTPRPGVVVLHDAFGRGEPMIRNAERLARLGFAALAADVWGEALVPPGEDEIGPLIGAMVHDPAEWNARIAAAHEALAAQPEVDAGSLASLGFCFGGSSALEYVRQGGDVQGAVSIHGGLDLVQPDWAAANRTARVLLCTGSADPMATREQRADLETAMSAAGVSWEVDLYGAARHAFTNPLADRAGRPDVFGYDARAAARAWATTEHFLTGLFSDPAAR